MRTLGFDLAREGSERGLQECSEYRDATCPKPVAATEATVRRGDHEDDDELDAHDPLRKSTTRTRQEQRKCCQLVLQSVTEASPKPNHAAAKPSRHPSRSLAARFPSREITSPLSVTTLEPRWRLRADVCDSFSDFSVEQLIEALKFQDGITGALLPAKTAGSCTSGPTPSERRRPGERQHTAALT